MKCIRCGAPEKSFGDGHACTQKGAYQLFPARAKPVLATVLVVVEGDTYSRYVGRDCTHYLQIVGEADIGRLRDHPETFTDAGEVSDRE